jgi:hypothetical protein
MNIIVLKPLHHRNEECLPRWIKKILVCTIMFMFY